MATTKIHRCFIGLLLALFMLPGRVPLVYGSPGDPDIGWIAQRVDTAAMDSETPLQMDQLKGGHGAYLGWANEGNGNPVLALNYAVQTGQGWTVEPVETGRLFGPWLDLALDEFNFAHIVFSDHTSEVEGDVRYACKPAGEPWTFMTVNAGNENASHIQIRLDSLGFPVVSYLAEGNLIHVLRHSGSTWDPITILSGAASAPALEIDRYNRPTLAYIDSNLHLVFTTWNGSQWDPSVVDPGGNELGDEIVLALDSNDDPHIAYKEWSATSNGYTLHYATRINSTWSAVEVDPVSPIEGGLSMVLDSQGRARIVYKNFHPGQERLWYAVETEAGWDLSPIGDFAKGSYRASLALGENDKPGILTWDQAPGSPYPIQSIQYLALHSQQVNLQIYLPLINR